VHTSLDTFPKKQNNSKNNLLNNNNDPRIIKSDLKPYSILDRKKASEPLVFNDEKYKYNLEKTSPE
jgi:hypothetical protein